MAKSENHEFCQNIKSLLNNNGFGYIWNNPSTTHKNFHQTFVVRLQNNFDQFWNEKCKSSNVTKLLHLLKEGYSRSNYLMKVNDLSIRRVFTQLRTGSHGLNECTGRYQKIDRESRRCLLCNSSEIEDVQHFILHCSHFADIRKQLYIKLKTLSPAFEKMSSINKLKYILNVETKNNECISVICAFIKSINAARQLLRTKQ